MRVGRTSVQAAHVVKTRGTEKLKRAVWEGRCPVQRAAEIAKLDVETQDALAGLPEQDIVDNHERIKRDARRTKMFEAIEAKALPEGKWPVLYADPPWTDEFGQSSRVTELHYPLMETRDIMALDVEKLAADDAVLFLWALPHMNQQGLDVMKAWGFQYRTQIVWSKNQMGLGQWARQEHEILMIGRRGAFPAPRPEDRVGSVIEAPIEEHSRKPAIFAELIQRWYPDLLRIELFARVARSDWHRWGAEAPDSEGAP
jgi:N6-adenosine-specific RNA methylase IME4